jgi:outer membrane protein assembly factor BamB
VVPAGFPVIREEVPAGPVENLKVGAGMSDVLTPRASWLSTVLLTVLIAGPVRASDWPMARHDPQRTAHSSGRCDIDRPARSWRFYLGSALQATAYINVDVDGDGLEEVVSASTGRIRAQRPNGITVWETPPFELSSIGCVADCDGDGGSEVVGVGVGGRVVIVALADGEVLWELLEGVIATTAIVRIADLDGDMRPDLYVAECRCCVLDSGQVGVAYSFASGFGAADAVELWRLAGLFGGDDCGASGDTVGDFNGDGSEEIVVGGNTNLIGVDGATGRGFYSLSTPLGYFMPGAGQADVADTDGDGASEYLLFEDYYAAGFPLGRRWVALFDYNGLAGSIELRWTREVANPTVDRHQFQGGSLADLDGDGDPEVVTSFLDGSTATWTTFVFDARDGSEIASLPGWALVGVADVDAAAGQEFFGQSDTTLGCFALVAGSVATRWTRENVLPLAFVDWSRRMSRGQAEQTATLDVDGDGLRELLVTSPDEGPSVPQRIAFLDAESPIPGEAAAYVAPIGVRLSAFSFSPGMTTTEPQVTAVRSDGIFVVFNRLLRMMNYSDDPSDARSALRVGGYYSGSSGLGPTPVVARGRSTPARPIIAVRTSRGSLVRLDATGATLAVAPTVLWDRAFGSFPSAVDITGDGEPEIVYWTRTATRPPRDAITAISATWGGDIWSQVVGDGTREALHDLPYGDANGDGVPDVFYATITPSVVEAVSVLDGTDGSPVWSTEYARALTTPTEPMAVGEINGDGRDDVVAVLDTTFVLSGVDGRLLAENATPLVYMLPIVADLTPDPGPEILLHAGAYPPRLLRGSDLTAVWTGTGGPSTGAFGTLVQCGPSKGLVAGRFQSSELRFYDVTTGVVTSAFWLGGGALFGSEAEMAAAGVRAGSIAPVSSIESFVVPGRTAVFAGSTDGFLYALDPCDGILLWSLNLGAPVGEPVIADTDGDGSEEILVSVADGYLYNVDEEATPAPSYVWDTDPPHGYPSEDRDAIESLDTLYAKWAPVSGATSYEYSIAGPRDVIITTPEFVDAGPVTTATASGLSLQVGDVYYFAVRALGPAGRSFETLSDGIEVVDRSLPDILLRAAPRPFSPDGDGIDDVETVTAEMRDALALSAWQLTIFDGAGATPVRTFAERSIAGTTAVDAETWNGTDDLGRALPEGVYVAMASVRDVGGNSATARVEVELVLPSGADGDADGDALDAEDVLDATDRGSDTDDGDADVHDVERDDTVADLDADESPTVDAGWSGGGSGCGCRVAAEDVSSNGGLLLLLLLGVSSSCSRLLGRTGRWRPEGTVATGLRTRATSRRPGTPGPR